MEGEGRDRGWEGEGRGRGWEGEGRGREGEGGSMDGVKICRLQLAIFGTRYCKQIHTNTNTPPPHLPPPSLPHTPEY